MIILIIPFGLIHVIFQSHESQKKQNDNKSEKYKCEAFQFLLQFAGKIETESINHLKKKKKNELEGRREKRMGYAENIEKYQLGRTIGEGTFAKVKVANNVVNGKKVAIKIIDKKMVIANDLMYQVQREIRTMKLLNHPNIVRIHEVIGTKTKIYIVMGYAAGGQLSDKLSYVKNLSEKEARKYFQQLIDAVEYCHCRGVYHRDIKPQNLLLDSKGNLKVSDFGLSALQKPGTLLSTACGSPCYVAPELLRNKGYEGAAADVWACGVVLFELLAGRLPFNDHNLLDLYKKILTANYRFPEWFTKSQRRLISKIFDPNPNTRISIIEIIEDEWFQTDYEPAVVTEFDKKATSDDICAAFNSVEDNVADGTKSQTPGFINAFQLIAMSHDLDLSGLFEEKDEDKHRIMLGSKHTINETIERIEAAARDASLSIERMNSSKIKIQPKSRTKCRSCCNLMAEVIEVAPTDCVVEISKSDGKLELYQEFCKSLSSLLTKEPSKHIPMQRSKDDSFISTNIRSNASSEEEESGHKFCGYSSS